MKRHGIDWNAQPLGLESDCAIAERLGVGVSIVWRARKRLGIPAADPAWYRPHANRRVDWDAVSDLGISSDREIADRLGVDRVLVQKARDRRKIRAAWLDDRVSDRRHAARMRKRGLTYEAIGSVLGVRPECVWRWLCGRGKRRKTA